MSSSSTETNIYNRKDLSSLSNSNEAITTNIHLEWNLDFKKKVISGTCAHSIKILAENVKKVDFDSSKLTIEWVKVNGAVVNFEVEKPDAQLGSRVSVQIPEVGSCTRILNFENVLTSMPITCLNPVIRR